MTSTKKTGRTLTLKIKYSDFTQITSSKTALQDFKRLIDLKETAYALLDGVDNLHKGVRLIGVSISNFEVVDEVPTQLTLGF